VTDETAPSDRRALLGAVVLLLTCLFSNLGSLPITPGDAFDQRAAILAVRELGAVGYFAQLATGVWLALALIFDLRRGARFAFGAWLVALGLFSAPLPALGADLALAPALLTAAALLALLTRALETATRRDAA
jgi:hypothetical protein